MTCSYSKEFSSSAYTDIENLFIKEYMPTAPGDAVKVYLYGLFLCGNPEFDEDILKIAEKLSLTEEKIIDCFLFWEEFGLVSILSREPLNVKYLPVHTAFVSGKPRKYKAEKYTDFTKGVQALLPSRMVSTSEYTEYFNIMETYSIKPDAMLLIVKYCTDKTGDDVSYRYISKVAKDFGARGICSVEKVEKELSSYVLRTAEIQKVLSALSLKRQADIDDLNLLNKWTKELSFETDNIVFAAKKIKKGSMEKLDRFLMELYAMKSFSKEEIDAYVNDKQRVYQLAININKALSIYMDVIDPAVDNYTKKWLSYGYDEQTLLFIASYCFKTGKNSLGAMDELVSDLTKKGVIDIASVSDYFDGLKKSYDFLKSMLTTCGISRNPNAWDRQRLELWQSWNFTDEMILEAAKISAGKDSPLAYINGVLSNWKNNEVFSPDKITGENLAKPSALSTEEYNREYQKRRGLAAARAQKNIENAMAIEGFADAYLRLNSIEKDLAFASMGKDTVAYETLKKEKTALKQKVDELLRGIGLDVSDLSPKYACEKCHDTGYVGAERCDCFNKKP